MKIESVLYLILNLEINFQLTTKKFSFLQFLMVTGDMGAQSF